jgi:hypothetical protein
MDPPPAEAQPLLIYFPVKNCAACGKETSELYSRTIGGKEYCIPCLNRGAGIEEYEANGLGDFVTEKMKAIAKENGFLQ